MSRRPEILAPAGDRRSLLAALHAGADAVYLGLAEGWNARARAENFALSTLQETAALVHRAGARVYVALNTLVFDDELQAVEDVLHGVARSGADAVIIQDPAVALLARRICPGLPLHASTQMTVSSRDAARMIARLGVQRVIMPRELSLDDLQAFSASSEAAPEIEVFVHGALCMSWSGQCLASFGFGGRSANRGRCAHPCRLPYRLIVDGHEAAPINGPHLLSARDLAGEQVVGELAAAGVASLKIEGRQKGSAYVMTAVRAVRAARDGDRDRLAAHVAACATVFCRGFTAGFLRGTDHRSLVEGQSPGHRGVALGRVRGTRSSGTVLVDEDCVDGTEAAPRIELRAGVGIAVGEGEQATGGPLHRFERAGGDLTLHFGRPGPDITRISPGQRVFVNSDPALEREADAYVTEPAGRIAMSMRVSGAAGAALRVEASAAGRTASAVSRSVLNAARGAGLERSALEDKLAALGGTPFRLERLDVQLPAGLHLPVSELKVLRRSLVRELTAAVERGPELGVASSSSAVAELEREVPQPVSRPLELVVLCRTEAHVEAAVSAGAAEVEVEARSPSAVRTMVSLARQGGLRACLVTLRVDDPAGSVDVDAEMVRRTSADGVLVRNCGALVRLQALRAEMPKLLLHGDASLNASNRLSARWLLDAGLDTITPAADVDDARLPALCRVLPGGRITANLHARVPLFHTQHCVWAHQLSRGHSRKDCGRPCDRYELAIEDRRGERHPLRADLACRNTVFSCHARRLDGLVPVLLEAGVRRFRGELLDEDARRAVALIARWRDLLLKDSPDVASGAVRGG